MEDWIKDLIRAATRPIRDIANAAAQRIGAVYQAFINVFARTRNAFTRWVNLGRAWATAQARHALATLNKLRWLLTVEIPRRAAAAARSIEAWTRERIAAAVASVRAEATRLGAWIVDQLSGLLRALSQVRDWATGQVARLWADLIRTRDRVFGALGTPERLVTWILAAMAAALFRLVVDNLDRYADYAWRNRANLEDQALSLTERILDRIM